PGSQAPSSAASSPSVDSVAQQEKVAQTQIHEGTEAKPGVDTLGGPGKEGGGEIHFCENTNDTTDICNAQWMMLYTAAAYAPDRLSSSEQKVYTDFFDGFIDRCEHPIVGGMIEDEIQRSRPRVASNKEMLIWLCTIENKCRQRLGMPMTQCRSSRLLQRWRYADGYL
ncbi:hypothetical protein FOZ63_005199, partial [Perkinsus olseni]